MHRSFTTLSLFVFTLCLSNFAFAEDTKEADKPKAPPATAIGTGAWADGLMHVQHGTQVGRACLEIKHFTANDKSYAYACLTASDRRYHVIQGTSMASEGYSRISDVEFAKNGELSYIGYEDMLVCTHKAGSLRGCKQKDPPSFRVDQPPITMGGGGGFSASPEAPPALPTSLTGGRRVTEYWMVNGHPLWRDCDRRNGCAMRWNGQTGKRYPNIKTVVVHNNKVAYVAKTSQGVRYRNGGDYENEYRVVWNKQEGEPFQDIWGLAFVGNTPCYTADHKNGLEYLVRGTRKEAFRDISSFIVLNGKIVLVGRKDPTPSKSPI